MGRLRLLLAGACVCSCGTAPSGASPDATPPTPDAAAGDASPPAPDGGVPDHTVTVRLPPAVRESGGELTVNRIFADAPAEEVNRVLPPGETEIAVDAESSSWLLISFHSPDGTEFHDGALLDSACLPETVDFGEADLLKVPLEYPTIQAAIDAAAYGDIVWVAPGRYTESIALEPGIRLIGSGPFLTILDAEGEGRSLIDFTEAQGAVVMGFQIRGVGIPDDDSCYPVDLSMCSGNWYAAAVYADGHAWQEDPCSAPSLLLANNVIEGNVIALMPYFHARVLARNNIFANNEHAVLANHLQDRSMVTQNVFWNNAEVAVASQAAYLDIVNNIFVGSRLAVYHQYIQTGLIRCNVFFDNDANGERVTIGEDGNLELDPDFLDPSNWDFSLSELSEAIDAGCFEGLAFDYDSSPLDTGAYSGAFGVW